MNNLEKAKTMLNMYEYTLVMCSGTDTITSKKRGVKPLLDLLDDGYILSEYSAADKVVGNVAAFLYVLLGIKEIYTNIISKSALATLNSHNIKVSYTTLADAIKNRDNTGFCPIETAVDGITDPNEALAAIRAALQSIIQKNSGK